MSNNDIFLDHIKKDLHEAFNLYYSLTFGFYSLKDATDKEILKLNKTVKNEVYKEDGKFYELFKNIKKVENDIYDFEYEVKKNDNNFNPDQGMAEEIKTLFYDAIEEIGELMFTYGIAYGRNLEDYLNNFSKVED